MSDSDQFSSSSVFLVDDKLDEPTHGGWSGADGGLENGDTHYLDTNDAGGLVTRCACMADDLVASNEL